ncbi:hypothetical protein F5Y15DRAFT_329072 [Xylariaceae sp. FL0016]|nr:hypothetical protein F5Y15DRAFT_329072 [Xylariaceae sp. FL0016]
MEETPSYFSYGIQNAENDDGYGIFDSSNMSSQGDFHQGSNSGIYADGYSMNAPSTASHPTHLLPMTSPSVHLSAKPARARLPSRDAHRLSVVSVASESPGLTSGSSSTPETVASQSLITPQNPADQSEGIPQNVGGGFRIPPLVPDAKKKGRRRQGRSSAGDDMGSEVAENKRNRFLERNRVAATKCRQKKKEWVSDLEETKFGLESQNSHLQMEFNGLVDEVSRIRAQLMEHANCHDPNIDQWIENEAKRFVLGASDRYDHMLAQAGLTMNINPRQGHPAPSNEYTPANPAMVPRFQRASAPYDTSAMMPNPPILYRTNTTSDLSERTSVSIDQSQDPSLSVLSNADEEPDFDGMPMTDMAFP